MLQVAVPIEVGLLIKVMLKSQSRLNHLAQWLRMKIGKSVFFDACSAAFRFKQMVDSQTFDVIETLSITSLKIRWNQTKNIIREIRDISFPCLKELYLNGNNIENIQIFGRVSAEELKVINFKENNINNLKAIRKCNLPKLEELMLYKNKIIDFRPLLQLHAPKLTTIWTTPQMDSFDMQDSISWVLRLQSKRMKNLFVKHEKGEPFNYDCMKTMIKQCYPGCKLAYYIKDDIGIRLE